MISLFDSYKKLFARQPHLFFKPFYHATNSSALFGILKSGKLISTGELLKRAEIPFSGELRWGISERGINTKSISLAGFPCLLDALKCYAKTSEAQIGNHFIDCLNEKITLIESSKFSGDADVKKFFGHVNKKKIEIYKKRIENFIRLPDKFKSLIDHPFPVVFGFNGGLPHQIPLIGGDFRCEYFTRYEAIPLSQHEFSLFVPKSKMGIVKKIFLHHLSSGVKSRMALLPIENLVKYYKMYRKYLEKTDEDMHRHYFNSKTHMFKDLIRGFFRDDQFIRRFFYPFVKKI